MFFHLHLIFLPLVSLYYHLGLALLSCQYLLSRVLNVVFVQVLAESEQMRKEADNVGPKAELDYWKKRMAKFNSLFDQIKGPECKTVVGVLHAAKSKLLKVRSNGIIHYYLMISLVPF